MSGIHLGRYGAQPSAEQAAGTDQYSPSVNNDRRARRQQRRLERFQQRVQRLAVDERLRLRRGFGDTWLLWDPELNVIVGPEFPSLEQVESYLRGLSWQSGTPRV